MPNSFLVYSTSSNQKQEGQGGMLPWKLCDFEGLDEKLDELDCNGPQTAAAIGVRGDLKMYL